MISKCHPERSEGSSEPDEEMLRCTQHDSQTTAQVRSRGKRYLQMSRLCQARLHCPHRILYHWLYDSCVAFKDKDKKPGDATTVRS